MPARFQTPRRSFLKTLGAAGVGAVALPQIVPSHLFGADAPSNKVNVAMLACGNRGRQLLPYVLRSGGNVVAICDVDTRQVAQMKLEGTRHGAVGASVEKAKVYEDYRKLLDDEKSVEAVVVCPGQRWHVPMSKRALNAGKHVYCEKPLAHSAAQAREIRELGRQTMLATQVGSQGGANNIFRRSMEVIQAGVLGPIREVHVWISKGCGPSREFDTQADPIPAELTWDFWGSPSKVLPFKNHYLGDCVNWGPWLEFGDGYLADMGAHCLNLPWRALKLTAPLSCTFKISEPLKDSYPSSSSLRWEFAAREGMPPVTLWWHDGSKSGPPEELGKELISTYDKVPDNGALFAGEKGILFADPTGGGGMVKLKGDAECRAVQDHEACKPVPVTIPRSKDQDNMAEWLDACRGGPKTFQGFDTAAMVAEIAMVGMTALRLGKPIEWDSEALKVKGAPEADPFIHRELRTKWL